MSRQSVPRHERGTTQKMSNLRKRINFNNFGDDDDGDVVDKMDLDVSEETSPSPPPIKMTKLPVSRVYQRRRSYNQNNSPQLSKSQSRFSPYTTPEAATKQGYLISPSTSHPRELVSIKPTCQESCKRVSTLIPSLLCLTLILEAERGISAPTSLQHQL